MLQHPERLIPDKPEEEWQRTITQFELYHSSAGLANHAEKGWYIFYAKKKEGRNE